jgi:hypothetical protein
MPPVSVQSKLKHEEIHSQIREVIYIVIKFVEDEGNVRAFTIPVHQAHKTAAEAT